MSTISGNDIHTKLAKVAGEIGSINKTERNEQQGFNFRSIEAITEKARPLLAREGISVMPRILSREYSEVISKSNTKGFRCIAEVEYTFTAGSDGSQAVASMIGEAADYGDKSTSKAVQMAYKYALTQVLQVGSGDDPDAHSVDVGHASESKPRQRSGPQQRTPRQDQPTDTETARPSSESPAPAAPTSNGTQTGSIGKIRSDLLASVKGDAPKAKMIWRTVLESFGLSMDDEIPADMVGPIETAVKAVPI